MKKSHIDVPEPSSKFYRVECGECNEIQVVYSHASTQVTCRSCGNMITEATGSKATIYGRIAGNA